jgi:hypothetical protein
MNAHQNPIRASQLIVLAALFGAACGGTTEPNGGNQPPAPPAGVPAALEVVQGANQTGIAGRPLDASPTVRVVDGRGDPVAAVEVSFEPGAGAGTVTRPSAVTDVDGLANAGSWTLGPDPGTHRLRARVDGVAPIFFFAVSTIPPAVYDIVVRFNAGNPTTEQQQAFRVAEARWQAVISGDLTDITINEDTGFCGSSQPIDETIDDLLILADVVAIDGRGGVLGSAGPCVIRSANGLPLIGRMRFDSEDLLDLELAGRLDEIIVHEMGHVLGIGGLWDDLGLVAETSGAQGEDPHFTGPQARAAFDAAGGEPLVSKKVPVEDEGGGGTRFVHWRERVMGSELMTGFVDDGPNPLSVVTVASLGDMGYEVDLTAAEEYTVPFAASGLARSPKLPLRNDILQGPLYRVDASGRIDLIRDF